MTDYQRRKSLRVKLNDKRNADKDHTGARYTRDAKVLNRAMRMYKIEGPMASW